MDSFLLKSSEGRRTDLLSGYYQSHHKIRDLSLAKDGALKEEFFRKEILSHFPKNDQVAVDLGCRWGILMSALDDVALWHGIDVDKHSVEMAKERGLMATQMDISINVDLERLFV